MYDTVFAVLSNPVEGRETEFVDWYTGTHVPDLAKIPSVVASQRFRCVDAPKRAAYASLVLTEVADVQETITSIKERNGTPALSSTDSIDKAKTTSWYAESVVDVSLDDTAAPDRVLICLDPANASAALENDDQNVLRTFLDLAGATSGQILRPTQVQSRPTLNWTWFCLLRVPDGRVASQQIGTQRQALAALFDRLGANAETRLVAAFAPDTDRLSQS